MACFRDALRPKSPPIQVRSGYIALCIVGIPKSAEIARFSNLIYALKEIDAKCTFFLQWHIVKTHMYRSFYTSEIAKLIALNGHTIAIDLVTTPCGGGGARGLAIELMEAMQFTLSVYGQTPRFVRMGGACTDGDTQAVLDRLGLQALNACHSSPEMVWLRNDEQLVQRAYQLMTEAVADKQKVVTVETLHDEIP